MPSTDSPESFGPIITDDMAALIWLELAKMQNTPPLWGGGPPAHILSDDEKVLYSAITKRLAFSSQILGATITEST